MTSKRKRLQVDASPQELELLEDVRKRLGCKANAEAVRKAVQLLDFVLQEQESGKKLAIMDEEGRVVQLTILL